MKQDVIIWGGTGNFKVLCELLKEDHRILGYFDNGRSIEKEYKGIPWLGGDTELVPWMEAGKGRRKHARHIPKQKERSYRR